MQLSECDSHEEAAWGLQSRQLSRSALCLASLRLCQLDGRVSLFLGAAPMADVSVPGQGSLPVLPAAVSSGGRPGTPQPWSWAWGCAGLAGVQLLSGDGGSCVLGDRSSSTGSSARVPGTAPSPGRFLAAQFTCSSAARAQRGGSRWLLRPSDLKDRCARADLQTRVAAGCAAGLHQPVCAQGCATADLLQAPSSRGRTVLAGLPVSWRQQLLGSAWNSAACSSRCSMSLSPTTLSSCSQGGLHRLCVVVLGCAACMLGGRCTQAAPSAPTCWPGVEGPQQPGCGAPSGSLPPAHSCWPAAGAWSAPPPGRPPAHRALRLSKRQWPDAWR